jgi:hypothetical protein
MIFLEWDGTWWRPKRQQDQDNIIGLYPEHKGYGALNDEDLPEFIRKALGAGFVVYV